MSRRSTCETDLGKNFDLSKYPDYRTPGIGGLILLEGIEPWSMAEHARAFSGLAPCPVCRGSRLRKPRYCLACDRFSLDGAVSLPGEPIGWKLNPEYVPDPPAVKPPDKRGLKGGLGDAIARRREKRRRARCVA